MPIQPNTTIQVLFRIKQYQSRLKIGYAQSARIPLSTEWRHAITITSARNISIEGITAISSGGDGM